jgi:hypothetical protein
MMRAISRLILLFLLCPLLQGSQSKKASVEDLIAHLRSRREATDFRLSGKLVRLNGPGKRLVYPFSMKGRFLEKGLLVLYEVTEPPPSRVRLLLESGANGRITVRMAHAGDKEPKVLTFEEWGEPLLDSDFTCEDLLDTHFLWTKQTLLREETYGARDCYVIRSEPGPTDRGHYSSVTTWLDRDIYYPIKVEKIDKASGITKEFTFLGLRKSKGLWSPGQIQAQTKGRAESTLLILARGSGKANIAASELDPMVLTKK